MQELRELEGSGGELDYTWLPNWQHRARRPTLGPVQGQWMIVLQIECFIKTQLHATVALPPHIYISSLANVDICTLNWQNGS